MSAIESTQVPRLLSPLSKSLRDRLSNIVDHWALLNDSDLRDRVVRAAMAHDHTALWSLTLAYLVLHGGHGLGISQSTCRSYRLGIETLVRAWQDRSILEPARDAGPLYARLLETRGLCPSSIGVRLSAVRQLYRALRWSGATHADPFDRVRPPVDRTAPWDRRTPYSAAEITALVNHAGNVDKVIVLLGAHGGLRASEMVGVAWEDIDPAERQLTIRNGKGGKTRVINVSRSLLGAMGDLPHRTSYLLPFRSYSRLAKRMYRLCDRADVPRRGLHALRHTAGTEVMRQLRDLEAVARHLGHANLETARVYAKWSDDRLRMALAKW